MALEPAAPIFSADIQIPPRTSSHQRTASVKSTFQDARGNTISPESPPSRSRSKRPMSGSTIDAPPSWNAQGKLPLGQTYRPRSQSSHVPTAEPTSRAVEPSSRDSPKSTVVQTSPSAKTYTRSPPRSRAIPLNMDAYQPPPISQGLLHHKQPPWSNSKEKILLGPYDYLFGHPGKDIRATLIASFNAWLQVPERSLGIITKVVGMLHTASLLVDDVEDSSVLRRGVPVAHSIFGVAQTINSANYVYFLALQQLSLLNNPTTIQIYTEELLNLHRGQGMDLYWRDTLTCPTEEDYLEMVGNKTGGLFRLAIKLMQAESPLVGKRVPAISASATYGGESTDNNDINCVPLVSTIGLLFQILDDILNLSSPTYTARKGLCEDLTEGKFSFPVIHAIRADPHNLTLLNILKQKTQDEEVKRYAVAYMEKMGSFEYSRQVCKALGEEATMLVGDLERKIGGEGGRKGAEGIRGILAGLKSP